MLVAGDAEAFPLRQIPLFLGEGVVLQEGHVLDLLSGPGHELVPGIWEFGNAGDLGLGLGGGRDVSEKAGAVVGVEGFVAF